DADGDVLAVLVGAGEDGLLHVVAVLAEPLHVEDVEAIFPVAAHEHPHGPVSAILSGGEVPAPDELDIGWLLGATHPLVDLEHPALAWGGVLLVARLPHHRVHGRLDLEEILDRPNLGPQSLAVLAAKL